MQRLTDSEQQKAKVFDNTVVRNLDVDRKHHRLIIGPGGKYLMSKGSELLLTLARD